MHEHSVVEIHHSLDERLALGKSLRQQVPRTAHAGWDRSPDRADPVELLARTNEGRVEELVPIRHARMMASPLAFLRGAAAAMAADLASTPNTGVRVQLAGDCHLSNFGVYGTPERNLIFDLNDFDETLPGPWEWDLKRLAASIVVAGRTIGLPDDDCHEAAVATVRSYRRRMREFAEMGALDVWYAHIDATVVLDLARGAERRGARLPEIQRVRNRVASHLFPRMTAVVDGRLQIVDHPPLVYHPPHQDHFHAQLHKFFKRYRDSLSPPLRFLLSRYKIVDSATKVVGVGSVGTRCAIMLLMAGGDDPLFLQYKEARESVLAPYVGQSAYTNQGERVVMGQRLMQSASDILLGWARDEDHDFYFRQLRDMKASVNVLGLSASGLIDYGEMCGWSLARAHAKSGDAAVIAGYLGKSDVFDESVAAFARLYADVTEQDHEAMLAAIKAGRLTVEECG
jgi:uncharacterized protein (DUF2252 family)